MSERGSSEPAWRIVRLRFERKTGIWRAIGVRNGRLVTILLPPSVSGESSERWVERIDEAFEQASSGVVANADSKRF
jgi:hypothetical protein